MALASFPNQKCLILVLVVFYGFCGFFNSLVGFVCLRLLVPQGQVTPSFRTSPTVAFSAAGSFSRANLLQKTMDCFILLVLAVFFCFLEVAALLLGSLALQAAPLATFHQCRQLTPLLGQDFKATYRRFNSDGSEAFGDHVRPLLWPLGCVAPIGTSCGCR